MNTGGDIIVGVAGFLLTAAVVGSFIIIYNSFARLGNDIKKSWANIDVLLRQRYDEVPNLVETVKGYMQHERDVFQYIARARADYMNARSVHDKAVADDEMAVALRSVFALSENYPELKSSENFLALQKRITGLENSIADRREFYNDCVNNYNVKVESFPDIVVAKIFGFTKKEYFLATDAEKKNVEIAGAFS